jgi:hypothetical protein
MEEGNREEEQGRRRGGGRGFLGRFGRGRGEGAVVGRSPGQLQGIRSVRRKLNEEELGDIFSNISSVMRNEIKSVVGNTPKEMQKVMKDGLEVMAKTVEEVMNRIVVKDRREGSERNAKERRAEECLARIEEKVLRMEKRAEVALARAEKGVQELEKKAEVGMAKVKEMEERIEERLEKVQGKVTDVEEKAKEDKVTLEDKVKSVSDVVDMVVDTAFKSSVRESMKEMEGKVRTAMCGVKVGNFNIGQETDDKAFIVRKVLGEVRKAACREEEGQLEKVLRRTRVVVLGNRTEGRREGEQTIQSVPILLQCQDMRDVQVIEGILKEAGYFPTLHWPEEMMEFIKGVREEVRRRGVDGRECWVRIRPVEEEGRIRIRVDTKAKSGGRFRLEGVWRCPPLYKGYWEKEKGLFTPL